MAEEDGAEQPANTINVNLSKRFVLPRQESVHIRLNYVKEALNELQRNNDEIIGMTLYGSMVTGEAKETSDIDGFVYLEETKTREQLTEDDWQWAKKEKEYFDKNKPEWRYGGGVSLLDYAATHHYEPVVHEALKSHGLTQEQINHMRVRVLSKEILKEEIEKTLESERKYLKYKEDMVAWDKLHDELPYDKWPDWNESPKFPDQHLIDWKVSSMFHLEVGTGLQDYRAEVIKRLKEEGEAGEGVWKHIIGKAADFERRMRGSDYENLFPTTLDQAADYYRIDIKNSK